MLKIPIFQLTLMLIARDIISVLDKGQKEGEYFDQGVNREPVPLKASNYLFYSFFHFLFIIENASSPALGLELSMANNYLYCAS